MTPREIGVLIKEWARQEVEREKGIAKLIGYSVVMFQNGKVPFEQEERKTRVIVNNDAGFAGM